MKNETIILGGGCFWCLDAVFREAAGIHNTTVGYAGGEVKNPNYRQVCTGETGHAEVIKIEFDPQVITLEKIFEIFFTVHDPTTLNRQGSDIGTQYRSIILYQNQDQMILANQIIDRLNHSGAWENPIVTQVVPYEEFYPAEDYHQNYFHNNPEQAYCQIVIAPKIEKFRSVFKK